jgi:hypothetical protein
MYFVLQFHEMNYINGFLRLNYCCQQAKLIVWSLTLSCPHLYSWSFSYPHSSGCCRAVVVICYLKMNELRHFVFVSSPFCVFHICWDRYIGAAMIIFTRILTVGRDWKGEKEKGGKGYWKSTTRGRNGKLDYILF